MHPVQSKSPAVTVLMPVKFMVSRRDKKRKYGEHDAVVHKIKNPGRICEILPFLGGKI